MRFDRIGKPRRIAFIYLGRRGALGRFTLELCQAAAQLSGADIEFIISENNDVSSEIARTGASVTRIPTFDRPTLSGLTAGFFKARRQLLDRLAESRPTTAITLMPHVWSPLLSPGIRKLGISYGTIVHDAVPHPGDPTAHLTRWLLRDVRRADLVITLSRSVADQLIRQRIAATENVLTLFHPDLTYGAPAARRQLNSDQRARLLLFGRIFAYKGLPIFIEALNLLRSEGFNLPIGVYGSGQLGDHRHDLEAIGAELVNRWIEDSELPTILAQHDVMVCSHIEASQSGVAATAFGAAMPVVALPVGGLSEQIIDGQTGVLAQNSTPRALANAIRRLVDEPGTYNAISKHLSETANHRSMKRFLIEIHKAAENHQIPSYMKDVMRRTNDDRAPQIA